MISILKDNNLSFVKLSKDNVDKFIEVQNSIFPNEKASDVFIKSLDVVNEGEETIYWIIKKDSEYIGIVGLYSYRKYPMDAWLGWFGIKEEYRRKGYAKEAFLFFENEAKKKNYNTIRLYTDDKANEDAVRFYHKMGMVREIYSNINDKLDNAVGNCLIFSKSLKGENFESWNNKYIGLNDI